MLIIAIPPYENSSFVIRFLKGNLKGNNRNGRARRPENSACEDRHKSVVNVIADVHVGIDLKFLSGCCAKPASKAQGKSKIEMAIGRNNDRDIFSSPQAPPTPE
jgi:hypothetical protein